MLKYLYELNGIFSSYKKVKIINFRLCSKKSRNDILRSRKRNLLFSLNLQCLEYVIYVNRSILQICRIHIPRLTYHSKILRNRNLHINLILKHVEVDSKTCRSRLLQIYYKSKTCRNQILNITIILKNCRNWFLHISCILRIRNQFLKIWKQNIWEYSLLYFF